MSGEPRVERSPKHVRGYRGGALVVDSVAPLLVWEHAPYPTYHFPQDDVRADLVPPGALTVPDAPTLAGLVRVNWSAMDEWFEEDEPVYVHARDPYTRVDILASSRHVVVEVGGVRVAESRQPRVLFETGLRPRYYLPLHDVRMDLLRPSATTTMCPYKGTATYWDVVVDDTDDQSTTHGSTTHRDVVWCYRAPLPESQKIAGLACFYDERVELSVTPGYGHR
ncbi:DUF427 domain-containing protein [Actinokineospora sp. NBRC 105648]|uniref:DUF427 domain-containing protein n=1 Tax=Actinokineospora sp. NBRC 105648 TaxID=3032206 RepID=UPI0024A358F5|nr:DUF427 domain-containing protein [Actinokineospora sp. NBRC 105648]GLZ37331.1 hypothetical protein Acsp05_09560 [Actinokineospora sp. NBRC 105648]